MLIVNLVENLKLPAVKEWVKCGYLEFCICCVNGAADAKAMDSTVPLSVLGCVAAQELSANTKANTIYNLTFFISNSLL